MEGGKKRFDEFDSLQESTSSKITAVHSVPKCFMLLIYEEQLHSLNLVPGFKLLPLIPFHSRKFSILIPGYCLEMVHNESPDCTSCTLEGSLGRVMGFEGVDLAATGFGLVVVTGFLG